MQRIFVSGEAVASISVAGVLCFHWRLAAVRRLAHEQFRKVNQHNYGDVHHQ